MIFSFLQGKCMIPMHIRLKWAFVVWYPTIPGPPPVVRTTLRTWYLLPQRPVGAAVPKDQQPSSPMTQLTTSPTYRDPRTPPLPSLPPRTPWCRPRCPHAARGRVTPPPCSGGAFLTVSPSRGRIWRRRRRNVPCVDFLFGTRVEFLWFARTTRGTSSTKPASSVPSKCQQSLGKKKRVANSLFVSYCNSSLLC